MAKPKLFLGLSAVGVIVTSMLIAGLNVADDKAGLINDFFNLNTQKVDTVESDAVEGSAYKDANGKLSDAGWEKMIADSYKFCEEAVEQGSVLLKNDNGCLPLKANERKVTLLGTGSKNLFMRSGAGGAAPNEDRVINFDEAFEKSGFEINKTVYNKLKTFSRKDLASPSTQVEEGTSIYTDDIKATFSDYSDAAIVTFVRIGTENTDPSKGNLDLRQNEKDLLLMIKNSGVFKKTIVLINSPLAMSMDWVTDEQYGIDAALFIGVPGYYGAGGVPHILAGVDEDGKVINASGHAPDTFAASASSSAAYQNFGNSSCVVYKEGVYVGYKYYETRYEDAVLGQGNANGSAGTYCSQDKTAWNYADEMAFPFGYGLSYTTFEQKILGVNYNKDTDQYEVKVSVKNTGDMDGKASVQVYVQQPYTQFDKDNGLGKASIALMNYDKVDVEKGKTVETTINVDRYFMTTYDYVVNKQYIVEGGDYYFAIGNGAHEALNNIISVKAPATKLFDHLGNSYTGNKDCVVKVAVDEDKKSFKNSIYDSSVEVTNQFDDADYNYLAKQNGKSEIVYLDRQDWQATWPTATTTSPATSAETDMSKKYVMTDDDKGYADADGIEYNVPYINDAGEEQLITFNDMVDVPLEGTVEKGKFAGKDGAEIWDAFIKQMTLDDLVISVSDNRGILDVKKVLKKGNSIAEGPEGILSKFQYGEKIWATGFPTGPTYTATFDHAMQKKFGGFFGEEALFCGVACINAPGCNINRTPYGSRASEYMTEDGVMNYLVASNVVGEARKKGLIMNIKHCFLNNQESGRQGVQTYCNEQAIREIYLRPFEGALTRGRGLGIMTSYNRIGACYAATHKPLMMNVMRGEWAYRGQIIDDALTGSNTSNYSNGPAMLNCGTDIFCLDGGRGGQLKDWVKSKDDLTSLKALQRANKNIMYSMSRSWMGGVQVTAEEIEETSNPWWRQVIVGLVVGAACVTSALTAAYVVIEVLSKKKELEAAK